MCSGSPVFRLLMSGFPNRMFPLTVAVAETLYG